MKKLYILLSLVLATVLSLAAQQTLTVADGPDSHSWFPFATGKYWSQPGSRSQVIYPADSLTAMIGSDIFSMKFYVKKNYGMYMSGGKSQISMGTTTVNSFSNAFINNLTPVAVDVPGPETGTFEIEVVFDNPFTYAGGNLVYEWILTEAGGQTTYLTDFCGKRVDSYQAAFLPAGAPEYDLNRDRFIPKTTFNYGKVFVTTKSLDFGDLLPNTQKVLTVKVKNIESTAITPTISGLTGPFSSTYTPTSLASGQIMEIPITYAPTELGNHTGTLTIKCGNFASYEVELNGKAKRKLELTVCDGTQKDHRVPIHGTFINEKNSFSQMIYPAEKLASVAGHKITSIKFYPTASLQWSNPTLQLSLKETSQSEFGDQITNLTTICNTYPAVGDTELVFNFNEPFYYNGNNFAVQVKVTKAGGFYGTYFYGESQEVNTGFCLCYLNNSALYDTEYVQFLPKMTITYADDTSPAPKGDVNDDGVCNAADVTALYNWILNNDDTALVNGDQNNDNVINAGDVTTVYNIILGNGN